MKSAYILNFAALSYSIIATYYSLVASFGYLHVAIELEDQVSQLIAIGVRYWILALFME